MERLFTRIVSDDLRLTYPQAGRAKALSLALVAGLGPMRNGLTGDVEKDDLDRHLADFAAYRNRIRGTEPQDESTVEESLQPENDAEDEWYRFGPAARSTCYARKLSVTKIG